MLKMSELFYDGVPVFYIFDLLLKLHLRFFKLVWKTDVLLWQSIWPIVPFLLNLQAAVRYHHYNKCSFHSRTPYKAMLKKVFTSYGVQYTPSMNVSNALKHFLPHSLARCKRSLFYGVQLNTINSYLSF